MASAKGLAGTVALLLLHGANAALKNRVRSCPCVKTCSIYASLCVYQCTYMYTHTCIYMNMYICIHKLYVDMLTSLLSQNDKTPPELSDKEEVKTVFAEHFEKVDITNENQNWLLLICARLGLVSRVRALLQAGAKAAHTDEVRVCEGCGLRTLMYMHACKHAFVKKCAYADRVRAQERLCIDTLTPLTPCCRPPDPPAHACMISQIHTHTRAGRQNGPVAGVREPARGSGNGAG